MGKADFLQESASTRVGSFVFIVKLTLVGCFVLSIESF
jgi:hypothetical protein